MSQDDSPSADPGRIESLAVTTGDVVDALEAAVRSDRDIVLRVTPPFSGRMRARLHDAGTVDASDSRGSSSAAPAADPESFSDTPTDADARGGTDASPIHLPPERFVVDPPAFPTVDETEDELRDADAQYTRDRHRALHQVAVEAWRERVRERLADEVTIETDAGTKGVSVSHLG